MTEEYSTHADYIARVSEEATARCEEVQQVLKKAFQPFIETRSVEVIVFSDISALDLGRILLNYPKVLKPLLAICNIGGRAIKRDLGIQNIDTYRPRLSAAQANAIAGYIKPFLPVFAEIPSLCHLDRVEYIDKEIRKGKGGWEQRVTAALNKNARVSFKKRKFVVHNEEFEIDAASPPTGPIQIGIDIKRIEARADIHKRGDEIVNKATKLKSVYPKVKFAAVVYYPFIQEHTNVRSRLESPDIDLVIFAGETDESIETPVRLLLSKFGVSK